MGNRTVTDHRKFGFGWLTFVCILLSTQTSLATVGLAEWAVYTPGKNMITHSDDWNSCGSICLKADDLLPSPQSTQLYVKSLSRWQYYQNIVAGEAKTGFFIFDETSKKVTYYKTEASMLQAIASQQRGLPISKWLDAQDAWTESWGPFYWKICKPFLTSKSSTSVAQNSMRQDVERKFRQECTSMFSSANLALFRKTTWGELCQKWQREKFSHTAADLDLVGFCTYVRTQ